MNFVPLKFSDAARIQGSLGIEPNRLKHLCELECMSHAATSSRCCTLQIC